MMNEFSGLVVDNMRKGRSMEKNKWKVDAVESFKRRSHMVQEIDDGPSESIDDELPELVVFLQETNYELVKDICIDKAVTSHEKCFEENCDTENGYVPCLLKHNIAESDGESTEESEDLESSTSSTESTQILDKDFFYKVNEKQKVTGKKAAASTNSIAISLNKILDENKHKGRAVARSNIEHGSIFHNSGLPVSTIGGGGSGWTAGCQHCNECGSTSTAENYAPENQTGPYRSHGFVYQREDVFSALDAAFNSVPKPSLSSYLGSVSFRSNSSTNSSHSFAFPILRTEWDGSPERMVNADQVQTRRRQLWKICFPCCNF